MPSAGLHQQIQFLVIYLYQIASNILGDQSSSAAMFGIVIIIQSPQIVNKPEILNHAPICTCLASQNQAVVTNPRPVGCTVNAIPIEPELPAGKGD
jgi:hypothetical protein